MTVSTQERALSVPELPSGARAGRPATAPDEPAERLPVAGLLGLAGSGTFAVWMSLTCFVC